jgi:HSP20 family molecular chaperone IbpA
MEHTVEEAIKRAKAVYEQVTGQPAPDVSADAPYARIPPEVDREEHVIRQAAQLFEKVRALGLQNDVVGAQPWQRVVTERDQARTVVPVPTAIVRGQDEVRYVFEFAGIAKDRVTVELQGLTLRVYADRPAISVERGEEFVGPEALRVRTERVVQLPIPVEPNAVSATFAEGLLTVRVRMPVLNDKIHKIEVR